MRLADAFADTCAVAQAHGLRADPLGARILNLAFMTDGTLIRVWR